MVSFSCEACGDVLTKKKLDPHRNQCRGASFTCLDCMVHFQGTDYRAHTTCISEAQKYQGRLYKEKEHKKVKGDSRKSVNGHDTSRAMVPRGAYVEDAPEGDDTYAVAIVDVPPRAPTPPPAPETLPENVNVFDFLVSDATPDHAHSRREIEASHEQRMLEHYRPSNGDSQHSQYSNGDGSQYLQHGFSYGHAPLQPTYERYDSWHNLPEQPHTQIIMPPPPYVTPGPRHERKDKIKSEKSDKKRKRHQLEDLDLSSARRPSSRDAMIVDPPNVDANGRVLHSGLTGGLSRLITDPDFYDDRIDAGPTPISPIKRTRREKEAKDDRRKSSYTSYSLGTTKTTSSKPSDEKRSRDPEGKDDRHRPHRRRHSLSSDDPRPTRHAPKAIEYPAARPGSVQPSEANRLVSYRSRAELFLSFIHPGPDSERGYSLNKALKRYHRERDVRGEAKDEDDKELWKALRLRRNDRGEIVLFV